MNTEKKLTAVEWFDRQLDFLLELYPSENKKLDELIKQAKEKEKQQIIDAWISGDVFCNEQDAERYFNKTFKKE